MLIRMRFRNASYIINSLFMTKIKILWSMQVKDFYFKFREKGEGIVGNALS